MTKVFHVYPLNLRGHKIVLSIYDLNIGEVIDLTEILYQFQ